MRGGPLFYFPRSALSFRAAPRGNRIAPIGSSTFCDPGEEKYCFRRLISEQEGVSWDNIWRLGLLRKFRAAANPENWKFKLWNFSNRRGGLMADEFVKKLEVWNAGCRFFCMSENTFFIFSFNLANCNMTSRHSWLIWLSYYLPYIHDHVRFQCAFEWLYHATLFWGILCSWSVLRSQLGTTSTTVGAVHVILQVILRECVKHSKV